MKIIRPTTITDALLDSSNIAETDYAAYAGGTTYAAGDRVISVSTHRVYESLQSANVGNALPVAPDLSTDWWVNVGATNRWRMFDAGVNTQAENADSVEVVLTPGRVDSLALLNIDAATYRVTVVDQPGLSGVTVYDSGVQPLEEAANISNWYEYFFEPLPIRRTDLVLTDLPPYTTGIVTILLAATSAAVKLGELVIGLYRDLGKTGWEPHVGIDDYSIKTRDTFGNFSVTQRTFSKRMSADVFIPNELIDYVIRILTEVRATPVVWIGDEGFTSTIVYGFFRSFDAVITSEAGSFWNLELEGLT